MKRRKGFTLIELLAVIVILAIIAVIATPIIVGIIEDSRKAAFERSVEGIVHAIDLDFGTQEILSNSTYTITDGVVNKTLKTPIKNIEGFSGTIKYDENGKSSYAINNGKWCITKGYNDEKGTVSEDLENCVLATDESCFTYEAVEGGVEITGYSILCSRDVVMPSEIDGKTVVSIGESAFEAIYDWENDAYINQLTSVKLPKNLKSIGDGAFYGNDLSGTLDLSDLYYLAAIQADAFGGNSISEVKLPNGILEIEPGAFYGNDLSGTLDLSNLTSLKKIGWDAFSYNSITEVKLPESIIEIEDSAFVDNLIDENSNTYNLIKNININAFYYPTYSDCFDYAYKTDGVHITGYDTTCAGYDVIIPTKIDDEFVVSIDNSAFSSDNLTSVIIPNRIENIGMQAFYRNSLSGILDLSHLTSLKKIGNVAFGENSYLSGAVIPSTVTDFGCSVFRGTSQDFSGTYGDIIIDSKYNMCPPF